MKVCALFVGLLCGLFSYSVCAQSSDYEKALQAFHSKEVDAAYIHVRNALKDQPEHLPSQLLHCEVLLSLSRYSIAEGELKRALELGLSPDLYAKLMGSALVGQFKYDEALIYGRQLALTEEGKRWVLLTQAEVYRIQGEYTKAHTAYQLVLKGAPEDKDANIGQISLWLTEGELSQAERALSKLAPLYLGSPEFRLLQGRLALRKGHHKTAIELFKQARELNAYHPTTLKLLATAYVGTKQFDAAEETLLQLLDISPGDPYALLMQANLLERSQATGPADLILNDLYSQLSNTREEFLLSHPQIILIGALTSYKLKKWQDAEQKFEQYLSLRPSGDVAMLLVDVLMRQQRAREALSRLEAYRSEVATDKQQALILVDLYLTFDKLLDAAELLSQLEQDHPGDAAVLSMLAKLHVKRGDYVKAMGAIERAKDQTHPDLQLMKASILFHQQQYAQSQQLVQLLLDSDAPKLAAQLLSVRNLFALNQLEPALTQAHSLYQKHPTQLEPALTYASVLSHLRHFQPAREILEPLLEQFPQESKVWLLLANLYQQAGQTQRAVDLLESKKSRTDFTTSLQLARLYYSGQEYQKSWETLQSLQFHQGLNPAFLWLKAKVLIAQKEQDQALMTLVKLRKQWQESAEQLTSLSQLYLDLDQQKEAEACLLQALEQQPDYVPAIVQLARLAMSTDDLPQAESRVKQLSKLPLPPSQLALLEGDLQLIKGDKAQAFANYQQSLVNDLSNTEAFLKLSAIAQEAPFFLNYIEFIEQLLSRSPERTYYRHRLADLLLIRGQFTHASEHYEVLLKQALPVSKRAEILNNLAYGLIQESKLEQAFARASQAIELAPDQPDIQDTYGWILVLHQQYEQGINTLRESLTRNSAAIETRFHLAYALAKSGKISEAKATYKDLVLREAELTDQVRLQELINLIKGLGH